MLKEEPYLLWRDVRFGDKCKVMDKTNRQLRLDEIGEVEIDLIGWRYSRVFGFLRQTESVGAVVHLGEGRYAVCT